MNICVGPCRHYTKFDQLKLDEVKFDQLKLVEVKFDLWWSNLWYKLPIYTYLFTFDFRFYLILSNLKSAKFRYLDNLVCCV